MIQEITIRGFKSLADVTVKLEPVTVLIGKSGTGKSNFMDAIQFLRQLLFLRNNQVFQGNFGDWRTVYSATRPFPKFLSFRVTFGIDGLDERFVYQLTLRQHEQHADLQFPPSLIEEKLLFGSKTLFHHENNKWIVQPNVISLPQPQGILLGAITGFQESSLAFSALTYGIGCYRFPDSVLQQSGAHQVHQPDNLKQGFHDNGANHVAVFADLYRDVRHWKSLKQLDAGMRTMKPTLVGITVDQPQSTVISTAHEISNFPRLTFDIAQESEGSRRLFACLLALYQQPSKQTLLFDEPEKGIYPAGLGLLAQEFNACAASGRGQVILTTHSPDFLDHFLPEQIRVVEMAKFETRIGPVEEGQVEAIKEQFLSAGELLTVDLARINESTAAETAQ